MGQCEWADYPTKVLERHWPDVPRWRDIRTLTKESFYERTGLRTVDIVSGGFPCQPFSVAGERRGAEDDRFLWPEMCRVVVELRPAWVLGENVPGIVGLALDQVLSDLEDLGYATQAFVVPACGVDAPHKRERVAILAYSVHGSRTVRGNGELRNAAEDGGEGNDHGRGTPSAVTGQRREDESGTARMADGLQQGVYAADSNADREVLQRGAGGALHNGGGLQSEPERTLGIHSAWDNWPDESGIPRTLDGVQNRMDRIRCLGNAVVPQQFYIFFKLIHDIERGKQ